MTSAYIIIQSIWTNLAWSSSKDIKLNVFHSHLCLHAQFLLKTCRMSCREESILKGFLSDFATIKGKYFLCVCSEPLKVNIKCCPCGKRGHTKWNLKTSNVKGNINNSLFSFCCIYFWRIFISPGFSEALSTLICIDLMSLYGNHWYKVWKNCQTKSTGASTYDRW